MDTILKWHYISEEGYPKLKGNRAKAYLICHRLILGNRLDTFTFEPNGKYIESCTIALIQKRGSHDGFANTPSMQFFWGAEIYDTAYAWAELPNAIPYNIEN